MLTLANAKSGWSTQAVDLAYLVSMEYTSQHVVRLNMNIAWEKKTNCRRDRVCGNYYC
jgi:uncharacterized protein with PhoU and TrkA domain